VSTILTVFDGPETEHNWEPREKNLQKLRSMVKSSGASPEQILTSIRPMLEPLLTCVSWTHRCCVLVLVASLTT
jgi:hypothetical protein